MENSKNKWFAFYSLEADEAFGHNTVKLLSGERVKYTAISRNCNSDYRWPDKVFLGECIEKSIEIDNYQLNKIFNTIDKISHPIMELPVSESFIKNKNQNEKSLKIGDICPICYKEYKQRELATSVYIGCHC